MTQPNVLGLARFCMWTGLLVPEPTDQASTLPFASTLAARLAAGDPRPSLQERYSSKADYVSNVGAAAQALVAERLLLQEDVAVYVNAAQSQTLLP